MTRQRWIAAAAVLLTTAICVAGAAKPASASCAPPLTISDAVTQSDLVVVGTVTSARSRNRIATVAVDEVWKGDAGSSVEVFGGPQSDNSATTVDRTYQVGARYLIVAYEPAAHGYPNVFGGRYEDNSCSVTQPWTDALVAFRPASAKVLAPPSTPTVPAVPKRSSGSSNAWIVALCAALLVVALTALLWVRRRRRVMLGPT